MRKVTFSQSTAQLDGFEPGTPRSRDRDTSSEPPITLSLFVFYDKTTPGSQFIVSVKCYRYFTYLRTCLLQTSPNVLIENCNQFGRSHQPQQDFSMIKISFSHKNEQSKTMEATVIDIFAIPKLKNIPMIMYYTSQIAINRDLNIQTVRPQPY